MLYNTVVEPCGYNGAGRRLGPTGRCLLVLDSPVTTWVEAQYACAVAMGNLASISNVPQENVSQPFSWRPSSTVTVGEGVSERQ